MGRFGDLAGLKGLQVASDRSENDGSSEPGSGRSSSRPAQRGPQVSEDACSSLFRYRLVRVVRERQEQRAVSMRCTSAELIKRFSVGFWAVMQVLHVGLTVDAVFHLET